MADDLAARIAEHGWRQGDALLQSDLKRLIPAVAAPEIGIVATHSCDLRYPRESAEPYVEVLLASRLTRCDGNLLHAKNSRRLHLSLVAPREPDGKIWIELSAHRKHALPRIEFAAIAPDAECIADEPAREVLRKWLANRYARAALPDEFNRRASRVENRMRRMLKLVNHHVSAVYIAIHPFEEIDEELTYAVQLLAVCPVDNTDEDLELVQAGLEAIKTRFQQWRVDVTFAWAKREDEVTLHDIRGMHRMPFEDLSLRDSDAPHPVDP